MEQESDFIKREIQKFTAALLKLIDKTTSVNINNFEAVVFETNEKMTEFFNLSIQKITASENTMLIAQLEHIDNEHLEKIIELLYQIILKAEELNIKVNLDKKNLSEKLILMIDLVNEKTNSFSVERMNIKNKLKQLGNNNE